jgi:hypothetical protein
VGRAPYVRSIAVDRDRERLALSVARDFARAAAPGVDPVDSISAIFAGFCLAAGLTGAMLPT